MFVSENSYVELSSWEDLWATNRVALLEYMKNVYTGFQGLFLYEGMRYH
jgi:hypothetical protein